MRAIAQRAFLLVLSVEGILGLVLIFRIPSMERNTAFLGFSPFRIGLGLGFGVLIGVIAVLGIKALLDVVWWEGRLLALERWLAVGVNAWATAFGLVLASIAGLLLLLGERVGLGAEVGLVHSVVERAHSVITWVIAASIQVLLLLVVTFRPTPFASLHPRSLWASLPLSVRVAAVTSLFHWVILVFQLPVFTSIPFWFWPMEPKDGLSVGVLAVLLVIALACTILVLTHSVRARWLLMVMVLLGYSLQIGYGFVEGDGIDTLRANFETSRHNVYVEYAAQDWLDWDSLRNYESVFGRDYYLGTKPPGVLLFYTCVERLVALVRPGDTFLERYTTLVHATSYILPLLAFLVVPVIYLVGRHLLQGDLPLVACLLYISCPNVLLIPLELDQVLFPLLFGVGAFLALRTTGSASPWRGVTIGGFVYLSLFFSFSLMPLGVFAALWISLSHLLDRRQGWQRHWIAAMTGFGLGVLGMAAALRLVLNYNFVQRFSVAMESHREIMGFQPGPDFLIGSVWLNNIEFATWIGALITVLVLFQAGLSARAFLRRSATSLDCAVAALAIAYVALNVLGGTRGEVGRLWLFLVPLLSVVAANQLPPPSKTANWVTAFAILLQLVTADLLFAFQDYF